MISGSATPEGTAAYAAAHPAAEGHWRSALDMTFPSIGFGSYLGDPDDATDASYAGSLRRSLQLGVNLVDTAANYRHGRSEKALGRGLKAAIDAKDATREGLILCTKGGYVPSAEPVAWFQAEIVAKGHAKAEDLVEDCHCMAPGYLRHQLDTSLANLGVDCVDVYYVHNPEQQLATLGADAFYARLTEAFRELEKAGADGKLSCYGTATWDGFRVGKDAPNHLSLERVLNCAVEAGGENHRFRVVQLPFNLGLVEAMTIPTQELDGEATTFLDASYEFGVTVVTSAPLLQGRLIGRMVPQLRTRFPGLETDAQRLIQFARSAPGIVAPLVGMKTPAHVEENLKLVQQSPLDDTGWAALFQP